MHFRHDDIGLVTLVRTNSSVLDRLPVQNYDAFHAALPIMRAGFAKTITDLGLTPCSISLSFIWATMLAQAMDGPDDDDPRRKFQLHTCGLGLLKELGFENVLITQTPDGKCSFQEIKGTAREAYAAVDRWMSEQHTSSRGTRRRKR